MSLLSEDWNNIITYLPVCKARASGVSSSEFFRFKSSKTVDKPSEGWLNSSRQDTTVS